MKKIIALFLSLILIFMTFFPSYATTESVDLSGINSVKILEMYPELSAVIKKGLENCNEKIYVSKFKLQSDVLFEVYKAVLFENPQLFHAVPTTLSFFRYEYSTSIVAIGPLYVFTKEELPEATEKFNNAVDYFLSGVDENWTDVEKCIYLHDLIITKCEYDPDCDTNFKSIDRTPYSALVNNETVCQGYSLAYNYLLSKLGIKAYYIINDVANHGWSLVELDGNYYHVDLTWDDQSKDLVGRLRRSFCLISDSRMKELRPSDSWTFDLKATDTTYDYHWNKALQTPSYIIDGKEYYIDNSYSGVYGYSALMCYDKETDTHALVYDVSSRWYADEEKVTCWVGGYSRLAYDGEKLYFNTSDSVYTINPDGTDLTLYYQRPEYQNKDIYGLAFQTDGRLYVEYRSEPTVDGPVYAIDDKTGEFEIGDTNTDGKISLKDATALQLCLAKLLIPNLKITALMDFNIDGDVSIADVTAIQKKLAGIS